MTRRRLVLVGLIALACAPLAARADIEEQRRRLPPSPAGCPDAIEGDWSSLVWTDGYWLARTMHVHRTAPGASSVAGTVDVEVWVGPEGDTTHTCDAAHSPWYVGVMPARGAFDGTTLDFVCTSFTLRENRCGASSGAYNPDHFTGPLVAAGTEIHTTNDDTGNQISTVVFRRVACAAPPVIAPPPPPTSTRGCSCLF